MMTGFSAGRIALVIGVLAASAAAGYGVWSRDQAVVGLQQRADDVSRPRVATVLPKPSPAEEHLRLPGQVSAWNEAQIYGQVSGYISSWDADYGAHVQAGQVLATINTPSIDAEYAASQAQLNMAQTNYDIAALTAQRFDALKGSGAVTQQQIDDKNATSAAQKAQLASAEQNVEHYKALIGFKKIVAPFAGIVTARRVNLGDFIGSNGANDTRGATGQAPFAVGDIHMLRVFVSVPQSLSAVLKPGLEAEVHQLNETAKAIPAKFLTMAGAVQTATRTIITEFVIDHPENDGLMPGSYVTVNLSFPSDFHVMTVPSQALLFRAEGMQVAVIGGDDRVHLTNINVGRNLGLSTEVMSGLNPDDKIVADPSLGLLDGQKVVVVQSVKGYEPDPPQKDTPTSSNQDSQTTNNQLSTKLLSNDVTHSTRGETKAGSTLEK